ncbi:LytTr DNA-binding domain-containing protein [Spirosoma oryzae]|uniref:LytTr DNA-binding domain-containing protein n=1 Tax=Spirosoma oryzae TaxID=1469603 RepID=A0A2T0T5B0_9BACT|nr:LytTR family transcriptional regulator DNA-binding domain-containing protein [Spirosoma oryzae]PRY40819.1 LytTr DNA-binding domain-containing protein [Spirosoma oryzae]
MIKRVTGALTTKLDKIQHLLGDGNYTQIIYTDLSVDIFALTVRVCVERQPALLRIHKRYAVNPKYVIRFNRISRIEATVTLSNGLVLPVARRRIEQVRQQLTESLTAKQQTK